MDVLAFLMARVVLSSSVAGNTHIRVHEEVTGLGNFTREAFCCFLGETYNIIYNSPVNRLLMLFSGQKTYLQKTSCFKVPQ